MMDRVMQICMVVLVVDVIVIVACVGALAWKFW